MTELSFANKLYAHLAEGITSSQTTIPIVPNEMGNVWAGFKPGVYLYLVIMNELGQKEIVKVTDVQNNALTVLRGQGGTTARAFAIGSPITERTVAEQASYMLQRGVFRQANYNPNNILTGDFNGEKFWQTGPASDQKRWWINAGGGNKWRLLTGDIYGDEYRDEEGFIIKPPGWTYAAPYIDYNGVRALTVYDGELYTSADQQGNLLWFNVDWLYEVAPYIFPVEGVNSFCTFSGDGYLYAAMPRRRLFRWNGVDDWDQLYNGGSGLGYIGLVDRDGTLYTTTGGDGQLLEWNGSTFNVVAPQLSSNGIHDIVLFGGEIYALTYYSGYGSGGQLFRWNGVNAWVSVAPKYSDADKEGRMCVHGGKIYAGLIGSQTYLAEWNGVDAWTILATFPAGGALSDMTSGPDGNLYIAYEYGVDQSIYTWDGAELQALGIPLIDDPSYAQIRQIIWFNGELYSTCGWGFYIYTG